MCLDTADVVRDDPLLTVSNVEVRRHCAGDDPAAATITPQDRASNLTAAFANGETR